jgi:hypothetical protein
MEMKELAGSSTTESIQTFKLLCFTVPKTFSLPLFYISYGLFEFTSVAEFIFNFAHVTAFRTITCGRLLSLTTLRILA